MTEENRLSEKTKTQQVEEMIVDSLTEVSKGSYNGITDKLFDIIY
ncbi:hypothetical protein ACOJIU_18125 (plasmid) [Carnobacterium maltaromaticum]